MIHNTWKRLFCRWKRTKRAHLDSTHHQHGGRPTVRPPLISRTPCCLLYTCQAGVVRAFPSSFNILQPSLQSTRSGWCQPGSSIFQHNSGFFLLSLHFSNPSSFPPQRLREIPVLHIYTRKDKGYRQISQDYLRKPCISSNRLLQYYSEKFLVLVYIPRPDFSTRLGIKQHINWPKNITLHSSTELIILLQKLPAQRPQSRNRIYPLFLKKTDPT